MAKCRAMQERFKNIIPSILLLSEHISGIDGVIPPEKVFMSLFHFMKFPLDGQSFQICHLQIFTILSFFFLYAYLTTRFSACITS